MRFAPPPGLLSGLEAAHGPLRRIFVRARRLGFDLLLLRLRFAGANGANGRNPNKRIESFLPRLSAELRATDLAWRGRSAEEWLILLEATADANAAIRRWQTAAQAWGLELRAQQVVFPSGGLTFAALLAALQPERPQPEMAADPLRAAGGRADGG